MPTAPKIHENFEEVRDSRLNMLASLLVVAGAAGIAWAHPTKYPHVDAIKSELRAKMVDDNEPPAIMSWHGGFQLA